MLHRVCVVGGGFRGNWRRDGRRGMGRLTTEVAGRQRTFSQSERAVSINQSPCGRSGCPPRYECVENCAQQPTNNHHPEHAEHAEEQLRHDDFYTSNRHNPTLSTATYAPPSRMQVAAGTMAAGL